MHNSASLPSGRYGPSIAVMQEMGWSWFELCNTPADLIQEIQMHIHYRQKWTDKKRALDVQRIK